MPHNFNTLYQGQGTEEYKLIPSILKVIRRNYHSPIKEEIKAGSGSLEVTVAIKDISN